MRRHETMSSENKAMSPESRPRSPYLSRIASIFSWNSGSTMTARQSSVMEAMNANTDNIANEETPSAALDQYGETDVAQQFDEIEAPAPQMPIPKKVYPKDNGCSCGSFEAFSDRKEYIFISVVVVGAIIVTILVLSL